MTTETLEKANELTKLIAAKKEHLADVDKKIDSYKEHPSDLHKARIKLFHRTSNDYSVYLDPKKIIIPVDVLLTQYVIAGIKEIEELEHQLSNL